MPPKLIGAALLAVVLAGALYTARFVVAGVTAPPLPVAGEISPDYTLTTLDGRTIDSTALRGQVVMLDFWATWCSGCMAALPNLRRLADRFDERGVVVIGVNQEPESPDRVRRIAREKKLEYAIAIDDGAVRDAFRVRAVPTVVLIDRDGVVRATHERGVTEELLAHQLDQLLD